MNLKKIAELSRKIEEYNGEPERILSIALAKTIINNTLPWKISCTFCENQNSCNTFKLITELIQDSPLYTETEYHASANRCDTFSIIADPIFEKGE